MSDNGIKRVTGLLVIEVRNANPNGDPDQESDPRNRGHDGRGLISAVSFKRKLRDLLADQDSLIWRELADGWNKDEYQILETRGRNREEIKKLGKEKFQTTYWDARLFGNTFLEGLGDAEKKEREKYDHLIRAGVAHFGTGLSIAPVRIHRDTWTNKAGVQEGKDRGMAPHASRFVEHGVYCMPFFVNPTGASKTGCRQADIELLSKLIPYAYRCNPSVSRHGGVEIRHAWWVVHKSPLGDCSDFRIIDALTPRKRQGPEEPSSSWDDYDVPSSLPQDILARVESCQDLMG